MRTINEIASWYHKNNVLKKNEQEDMLRINLLCIYTKVAYSIKNLELTCNDPKIINNTKVDIGITDINVDSVFTEEELKILKTINREYGYLKINDLLYDFALLKGPITISNIISELTKTIIEDLEGYNQFEFNETTITVNDKIFFVDNNTEITDELLEKLKNHSFEDQYIFTVYDAGTKKGPMIY